MFVFLLILIEAWCSVMRFLASILTSFYLRVLDRIRVLRACPNVPARLMTINYHVAPSDRDFISFFVKELFILIVSCRWLAPPGAVPHSQKCIPFMSQEGFGVIRYTCHHCLFRSWFDHFWFGNFKAPSSRSSISPAAQGLRRSLTPAEQAVLSQTNRGRGSPVRRRGSGAVRGRNNRQNGGQYDGTTRCM